MTDERLEVQRMIEADPAAVFRVLCDPQGHVAIDSTGMLMGASGEPVTAVGDTFVVHIRSGSWPGRAPAAAPARRTEIRRTPHHPG